jgi:hypothetical protein
MIGVLEYDSRRCGNFSLHHSIQNGSGAHSAFYPMVSGMKVLGSEADRSSTGRAEIENAWIYTSTPPIRLHGVVLS